MISTETSYVDKAETVNQLLETTGIASLLRQANVQEIAINRPGEIWVETEQGWAGQPMPALSFAVCMRLAKALATYAGLAVPLGPLAPLASVIFPGGERGQIAVPPATQTGVVSLTVRKPATQRFSLASYQQSGRFSGESTLKNAKDQALALQKKLREHQQSGQIDAFFTAAVRANLTIMLVGGTGSGKTTVMKALVDAYPADRRLFTIEDAHELTLPNHPNHLHLFYQKGGVTPKQLIESCMRMKPDHVLLSELRGDEAWGYLELLNTGHPGSITTIHANDCASAFARLATLVKQSEVGQTLDYEHIMRTIRASIDVVAVFKQTHLVELHFEPEAKHNFLEDV